jgi:ectoine hydroxylase-related dioxygenase (phytanoyl-CoA dioxygenase family)
VAAGPPGQIIVALEDIGPGDGATVIVPGSHKSLVSLEFVRIVALYHHSSILYQIF